MTRRRQNLTGSNDAHTSEQTAGTDGKDVPIDRRSLLKAVGTGAVALSTGQFVGVGSAATVVDLGEKGLTEGDDITPYLEEYFVEGNEVHVPEGTYQWDGSGLDGGSANAALIGDGDVALDCEGVAVRENIVAERGTVRIKNITQTGAVDPTGSRFACWAEEGARLVLENFNRPDGQQGDGEAIGFFVPPEHAGTVVFRNCTVANFGNNGLYASAAHKGGDGPVIVEGGLYANNNVASVRVGSSGSVVRNVTILHDDQIPGYTDGGTNGRGLWVRNSGEDITIEDCDITVTSESDGAAFPLGIHPRRASGSGQVRNCRIWNGQDDSPIIVDDQVQDAWSGRGEHLTGTGELRADGAAGWAACAADDCAEPTRKKQWVGTDTKAD